MSELNEKLLEIKRQKDTYIIPENLKKDVTVFGVTGTYEGSGDSGDVKLFDTVVNMQADPNAQDGDLAVVYREELTSVTEDSEFDKCIFPNTVVLDAAFSDDISGSFRSTGDNYFDGFMNLSSSSFSFISYGDQRIRVQYTSQDGITYTRTDSGEELQEFRTIIKWKDCGDPFPEVIGNFMKIGGNYFEGLYKYTLNNIDKSYVWLKGLQDFSIVDNQLIENDNFTYKFTYEYFCDKLSKLYDIKKALSSTDLSSMWLYIGVDDNIYGFCCASNNNSVAIGIDINGTIYFKSGSTTNIFSWNYYQYNKSTNEFDLITTIGNDSSINNLDYIGKSVAGGSIAYVYQINQANIIISPSSILYGIQDYGSSVNYYIPIGKGSIYNTKDIAYHDAIISSYRIYDGYTIAPSQLDAVADYVYGKTFYGKNGVEDGTLQTGVISNLETRNLFIQIGNTLENGLKVNDGITFNGLNTITHLPFNLDTSNVTNMSNMFSNCSAITSVPQLDTSNVTNMNSMFHSCSHLTSVPQLDTSNATNVAGLFYYCSSLTVIPQLDTGNATDMSSIFSNCTQVVTIPVLNTSKVTNMYGMFTNCFALSNNSLNNILAMCIGAISYTDTKTLKYIGLSSTQATTCQSLSNYQAFINAGWTTGY